MYVSCHGRLEIVQLLLARDDIDVNLQNEYRRTALMIACDYGHLEIVKSLFAHDEIDVNMQSEKDDWTALMLVSEDGHLEIVKLLLARDEIDVSLNMQNKDGSTALLLASLYNHEAVVHALISNLKTAFVTIAHCLEKYSSKLSASVRSMMCEEITRRQMCVIYPPRNPSSVASVSVRVSGSRPATSVDQTDNVTHCSDVSVSGMSLIAVAAAAADSKLNGIMSLTRDHDIESESDAGGPDVAAAAASADHCALVSSFFKSRLLDVNLLRVIREYCQSE
jgi:ankyrin repeat protein